MEYLNREKVMEVNSKIIEYDLYHANTSLMRFYNLCPTKLIDKIDSLTKMSREVYVGKLQRDNKEFSKALMKSFDDAMKLFLDTNGITEDNIISIKKDAAFVVNKKVVQTDFDCLHFRPKNEYIGYALIGLYEIYFKSNGEDAWLSEFEGVVRSDGLILLSPGNIYTDFPEPLLDKLTELSEWLKEKECNTDSFDWDKFIKTPEYKDMFNTLIGNNMDWMTDYSNILSSPANSTTTNTYTSNSVSSTVTSASTDTITICTDGIANTLLNITGVSNCKN